MSVTSAAAMSRAFVELAVRPEQLLLQLHAGTSQCFGACVTGHGLAGRQTLSAQVRVVSPTGRTMTSSDEVAPDSSYSWEHTQMGLN